MTGDTARRSARRQLEQRGLHRVVESPPLDRPGVEIDGVGPSLFHLFRDELMRRRYRARAPETNAQREVLPHE